jgi:hypothetical protein
VERHYQGKQISVDYANKREDFSLFLRKLRIFDITKNSVMRAFQLFSGISLQANAGANNNIAMLDASILVPSICGIMILVIVAGIAVASQKHKRY